MTSERARGLRLLAWGLGGFGALACAATFGVTVALGFTDQLVVLMLAYLFGILMGLLGALIAAREPRNSIGWLMCATSLATSFVNLPGDYGYAALVIQDGRWPLGAAALWFGSWAPLPVLGLFLPLISVRFPDGKVRSWWHVVDWLAIGGTALWMAGDALERGALPLLPPATAALLAPFTHNPLGVSVPEDWLAESQMAGLPLVLLAYVATAAALIARYRGASHEQRIQLKWFAYAGLLIAATAVYGLALTYHGEAIVQALIPLDMALVTLPLAIGIAILRYRLYDIDLIINRTVVYGSLTAILAAAYTAGITLFQRLFVASTGQKSDAAYVLTAFGLVVAFSPAKDWLQKQVDRRVGRRSPGLVLDQFRSNVDAVVSVMDVHRVACRLLDEAVLAFDARGAALYLQPANAADPLYTHGHLNGDAVIEVLLRHEGTEFGRLMLGSRRGDAAYTNHDRETLQKSADSVGEALALAAHFGHRPLPKPQ